VLPNSNGMKESLGRDVGETAAGLGVVALSPEIVSGVMNELQEGVQAESSLLDLSGPGFEEIEEIAGGFVEAAQEIAPAIAVVMLTYVALRHIVRKGTRAT